MITLYFLRSWFKALLVSALAVVIEFALTLYASWWCVLLVPVTAAVFVGFTALLYGDWKAARRDGIGYRYDIVRDVTRTRGRG